MKFYIINKLKIKEHHTALPIFYNLGMKILLPIIRNVKNGIIVNSKQKISKSFDVSLGKGKVYHWMVNFSDIEFNEIDIKLFETKNFKDINPNENDISLHEFLKTKHTFVVTGNYFNDSEKGINSFELSNDDLMYMKLLE